MILFILNKILCHNFSRFICKNTIEENIKTLQDEKLSIADNVLSGTVSDKLTIKDLKLLFSMDDSPRRKRARTRPVIEDDDVPETENNTLNNLLTPQS